MKKFTALTILLASACSKQQPQQEEQIAPAVNDTGPVLAPAPSPATNGEAPLNPPAPGKPGGLPDDRTPISEGKIDPKSAQGAGQVLQHYFALAEQGKFEEANKDWSDGSEQLDLAKYKEVHANIGAPEDMEGAAGSSYVDIPVQLYGRAKDGKPFNSRGTMTLRRVNDVPGSTAEQRQWHIYKSDFPTAP
jgi:hypothetical protein